ncbi:MAG: hypothetical protein M1831_000086 [Alyxoria varia]|nr:MAG: hypothetical protein M1831_000086 [Alyxoria varia]
MAPTHPVPQAVPWHVRRNVFVNNAASRLTHTLVRRAEEHHKYQPGQHTKSPEKFNNKGMLALFALLGAAMVLGSIWFFFWARHGGFVWREGDWEDYKSTVLRRKGPDGKTLSNATPVTDLGQKSVAGTFHNDRNNDEKFEYEPPGLKRSGGNRDRRSAKREPSDEDVRAYRHEKPARVGGLNRQADGSHFEHTFTESSETISNHSRAQLRPAPEPLKKKKGLIEKTKAKTQEKKNAREKKKANAAADKKKADKTKVDKKDRRTAQGRVRPAQRRNSLHTVERGSNMDRADLSGTDHAAYDSYYANQYRAPQPPYASRHNSPHRHRARQSHTQADSSSSQQPSPRKRAQPKPPGSFDAYSDAGSTDTGTKVYEHPIAGIPRGGRSSGFRRGGAGDRRDSLSDSD